ncbi:MAG: HIT family protein [Acholeplasmataceae bacterium]
MSSVFTKIIRREVPAYIIYEDDQFIAFLDIIQATPGHTLVAIKQEYSGLNDVPLALSGDFFRVVKKIAEAVKQAFNATGVNMVCNDGVGAGQTVFHFHFHIVPRYDHDDVQFKLRNHMHETQPQEYMERAEKIKKALMS